uniref:Uncharacterized protein n=1 Tax=Gouania willdenowi TaxID=441366 RepID=A0A8C5G1J1_GOUWI
MAQHQETAQTPLIDWNAGLFDCFEDVSTCCYGFWCCPFLMCTVSGRLGENTCLPLYDIITPACLSFFRIPLFFPPAGISMRASMRNRYGIKGSLCKDIAAGCCCSCCSWCQMYRELKERKKVPTVIIMQPQNVVNSHPPPVMINNVIQSPVNYVGQPGVIVTS